jgi:hypothetical protein
MKACECGCGNPAPLATRTRHGVRRGDPQRFILGHVQRGKRLPPRSTGPYIEPRRGHVRLYLPEHANANRSGCVYEHTVIAARALGKRVPVGVVVHHVDYNGGNNTPRNLVICQDQGYHLLLHHRTDAFRATGNANMRKCGYCHQWNLPGAEGFYSTEGRSYHRACLRVYRAKKYALAELVPAVPSPILA